MGRVHLLDADITTYRNRFVEGEVGLVGARNQVVEVRLLLALSQQFLHFLVRQLGVFILQPPRSPILLFEEGAIHHDLLAVTELLWLNNLVGVKAVGEEVGSIGLRQSAAVKAGLLDERTDVLADELLLQPCAVLIDDVAKSDAFNLMLHLKGTEIKVLAEQKSEASRDGLENQLVAQPRWRVAQVDELKEVGEEFVVLRVVDSQRLVSADSRFVARHAVRHVTATDETGQAEGVITMSMRETQKFYIWKYVVQSSGASLTAVKQGMTGLMMTPRAVKTLAEDGDVGCSVHCGLL